MAAWRPSSLLSGRFVHLFSGQLHNFTMALLILLIILMQYLVLSNLRIALLNLWIPILICDMGLSNSRIALLNLWILALLCPQEVEGMKGRQKKAAGQQGALEVRLNRALEEAERYKTELATMRARSEVGVALWHACMCLQFHSEV